MAVQYWQNMSILEDGVEMACVGKSVSVVSTVNELDTTPLCVSDGYSTLIGGLKSTTVDLEIMQNFAVADAVDSTFWANFGTTGTVRSICAAADDGSPAYLMQGINLAYTPIEGSVGELAMGSISGATNTGPVVRGKLLHPSNVTRSSSSTGTGQQLGALSASQSMYAALHVISATGTSPTLDVIVQSDDNAGFTSPTTRITFTQATGVTSEWASVAGAVTDDYWRVSYTLGGTTPVFGFAVTCGIAATV